ncbi:UNVERIFIED_CONTAM: hypothetical protein K2H54_063922, partial [Gekko kuhli]
SLLLLDSDSISVLEEAGNQLFEDPEEKNKSTALPAFAFEEEVNGPQNTSKGQPQQFPFKDKQQRRNTETKWKREDGSSSSQDGKSQGQEWLMQERYPEATFPGGAMKQAIDSSPFLCDKAATVKPGQKSFFFYNLTPYPQWKKQEICFSKTQKKERDQQRLIVPR